MSMTPNARSESPASCTMGGRTPSSDGDSLERYLQTSPHSAQKRGFDSILDQKLQTSPSSDKIRSGSADTAFEPDDTISIELGDSSSDKPAATNKRFKTTHDIVASTTSNAISGETNNAFRDHSNEEPFVGAVHHPLKANDDATGAIETFETQFATSEWVFQEAQSSELDELPPTPDLLALDDQQVIVDVKFYQKKLLLTEKKLEAALRRAISAEHDCADAEEELERDTQCLQQELDDAQQELEDTQEELEDVQQELTDAQEEMEVVVLSLTCAEHENECRSEELDEVRSGICMTNERHDQEMITLRDLLDLSEQEERKAAKAVLVLQQERDKLRESSEAFMAERYDHQAKLIDIQGRFIDLQKNLFDITGDKKACKDELRALQATLDVCRDEKTSLSDHITNQHDEIAELCRDRSWLQKVEKTLRRRLHATDAELETSRQEHAELQEKLKEKNSFCTYLKTEIEKHEDNFAALTAKYESQKNQTEVAVAARERLSRDTAEILTNGQNLQTALDEAKSREQRLEEDVQRLKTRLEAASEHVGDLKGQHLTTAAELQQKEHVCAQLRAANEAWQNKVNRQSQLVTGANNKLSKLQDQIKKKDEDCCSLRTKLKGADLELHSLKSERGTFAHQLKTAAESSKKLAKEKSDVAQRLQAAEARIMQLQRDNDFLHEDLEYEKYGRRSHVQSRW